LGQGRGSISQSRDWASNIIGDCPGKWGRFYILQKMTESGSVKRGMIESRCKKEMNILPLKLVESQALVQGREDVLAY
jgi:hypothetical protein